MNRTLALLAAVAAFFLANSLLVVIAVVGVLSLVIFWVQMAGMLG